MDTNTINALLVQLQAMQGHTAASPPPATGQIVLAALTLLGMIFTAWKAHQTHTVVTDTTAKLAYTHAQTLEDNRQLVAKVIDLSDRDYTTPEGTLLKSGDGAALPKPASIIPQGTPAPYNPNDPRWKESLPPKFT